MEDTDKRVIGLDEKVSEKNTQTKYKWPNENIVNKTILKNSRLASCLVLINVALLCIQTFPIPNEMVITKIIINLIISAVIIVSPTILLIKTQINFMTFCRIEDKNAQ